MTSITSYLRNLSVEMRTAYSSSSTSKKFAILVQFIGAFAPLALFFSFQSSANLKIQSFLIGFYFVWVIINPINILVERIQKKFLFKVFLKKTKKFFLTWIILWIAFIYFNAATYTPVSQDDELILLAALLTGCCIISTIVVSNIAICFLKQASYKRELLILAVAITASAILYL